MYDLGNYFRAYFEIRMYKSLCKDVFIKRI